jgi:hypothetical protein
MMLLILILYTCSAILYLNEDFEGGEFIFATDLTAKNIQVCLMQSNTNHQNISRLYDNLLHISFIALCDEVA